MILKIQKQGARTVEQMVITFYQWVLGHIDNIACKNSLTIAEKGLKKLKVFVKVGKS